MSGRRVQKIMTQPINVVFGFLQNKQRIKIHLFEGAGFSMEGVIIGFDEFMNFVLDDASEVHPDGRTVALGRTLLKGDSVTLIHKLES